MTRSELITSTHIISQNKSSWAAKGGDYMEIPLVPPLASHVYKTHLSNDMWRSLDTSTAISCIFLSVKIAYPPSFKWYWKFYTRRSIMVAEVSSPSKDLHWPFYFFDCGHHHSLTTSRHVNGNNRASVPGRHVLKLIGAKTPLPFSLRHLPSLSGYCFLSQESKIFSSSASSVGAADIMEYLTHLSPLPWTRVLVSSSRSSY